MIDTDGKLDSFSNGFTTFFTSAYLRFVIGDRYYACVSRILIRGLISMRVTMYFFCIDRPPIDLAITGCLAEKSDGLRTYERSAHLA